MKLEINLLNLCIELIIFFIIMMVYFENGDFIYMFIYIVFVLLFYLFCIYIYININFMKIMIYSLCFKLIIYYFKICILVLCY